MQVLSTKANLIKEKKRIVLAVDYRAIANI
jgi:hypothetical protein